MKKQNLISAIAFAILMCSCGGSLSINGSSSRFSSGSVASSSSSYNNASSSSSSSVTSKKKVSLNELSNYAVNIAGAKAFGIKNGSSHSSGNRYANSDSSETFWVMTSEYYSDSQASVDSDGNTPVSFTKTIVTADGSEVTTAESFSINYQDYDINILKITSDGVYIPVTSDRQYMISIGTRSTDWMNGEVVSIKINVEDESETKCLFLAYSDYDSSICTIKSRNMNASYSFFSLEGDRYSIIDKDGNDIYADIVDNDLNDLEEQIGKIKVSGLVEGEKYTLKQAGIRYKETISQEDIDGKIDKLYVNGDYTFISFVPKEKGIFYNSFGSMYCVDFESRPGENELTYDSDGISIYDKCDYFSDSIRKSFIVDNRTGLIYLIEGFDISSIKKNLLYTKEKGKSNLVFDIRINDNKELEIYPLFTNSNIIVYDAFKDKYGNAYVWNDKINEYDENSKALYYVFSKGKQTAIKDIFYALNENKETVMMKIADSSLCDLKLLDENGNEKDITLSDSFFMKDTLSSFCNVESSYTGINNHNSNMPFKVRNGVAYSFGWPQDPTKNFGYNTWQSPAFASFDCTYKTQSRLGSSLRGYLNFKFLERYDILLILEEDGNLYSFSGFFEHFDDLYYSGKSDNFTLRNEDLEILDKKKILESCEMDTDIGNIVYQGLNGETYYEFYVEYVNGKPVIEAYKGRRTEEVEIVKLQPINL